MFLVENISGFGPRPARHRLRLQRQDELHDAVRLDVSSLLNTSDPGAAFIVVKFFTNRNVNSSSHSSQKCP